MRQESKQNSSIRTGDKERKGIKRSFLFRLAISELWNQKRLSLFFILNLTVGLISFVLLDSFKQSLSAYIEQNSQAMMTGDICVSARRTFTTDEDNLLIEAIGEENIARRTSYATMSVHAGSSKLVFINIIDKKYPLYGEVWIRDFDDKITTLREVREELGQSKGVIVVPELAYFYDLQKGDTVTINDENYEVKYIIEEDAGAAFNISAIAPKVYMPEEALAEGFLDQFGITLRSRRYLKLPKEANLSATVEALRSTFSDNISESELSSPTIRAHNNSGTQTERILQFIGKYLSLISLIALFLSGLTSAYLFRTFVHKRFKEIAILQSLGMKANTAFSLSIIELLMISFMAATLTVLLGYFLVPYVPALMAVFIPDGFTMIFSLKSVAITYAVSMVGAVVFCLPILISIRKFSLSFLFNDEIKWYSSSRQSFFLAAAAIPIFFYVMAIWLSESFKNGSYFTFYFFGFVCLTLALAWGLLNVVSRIAPRLRYPYSFVVKSILHYRVATLFYFAAISLSVMLITLVLQLERTIAEEAALPRGYALPTFIFYNIAEDSTEALQKTAQELGEDITDLTPMLSGRITHLNGEAITASFGADQDFEQRQLEDANRRVNLSYRSGLLPSETLHAGELFSGLPPLRDKPVEVSLDYNYATDMGVKIGDVLTMTLIDIPYSFEAQVVNFRRVKWNTFEPNFFIVLQLGVLEKYPKTFISTLSLTDTDAANKVKVQTHFARAFPDVSLVDIETIMTYILALVNKVILLVKALAFFSLILGIFLLFSVVNYQVRERRKEINMLKVIGSSLKHIKILVLTEYIYIGIFSIFIGLLSSLSLYYLVTVYIFENIFVFHPGLIFQVGLGVLFIITLVSFLAASSTLHQKPIELIKATD